MPRPWPHERLATVGPLGNSGIISHASWHISAVMRLGPIEAEQVLIDLLPEPEYSSYVAAAMARDFVPESKRSFDREFRYDLMWDAREGRAREGRTPTLGDEQRRTRFAAALNAEIKRLREQNQDGKPATDLKELANALAAIDGRGSSTAVLEVIAIPDEWDQYTCLNAAERLLMAGVVLPTDTTFALVDSITEQTVEKWMQDSDRYLLSPCTCPLPPR